MVANDLEIVSLKPTFLGFVTGALLLVPAVLTGCSGGDDDLMLSPEGARGREIANTEGCGSCHGGKGEGTAAPSWQGLVGTEVELDDGRVVVADEDYIRRSITDPKADLVAGYTLRMPENDLTDSDIEFVLTYIKELS